MDAVEDSVMIALLPTTTDWCKQDLPHMTLVFCGKVADLRPSDFNEMAKDACSIAQLSAPVETTVLGIEVFGDDEPVNVLKLSATPELLSMRNFVDHWNASTFPFSPHATIGPEGTFPDRIPRYLTFDRIVVAWGDEQLTFWLKKGYL